MYRYPEHHIQGWMSLTELNWLYRMAQRYQTIVEVGSWQGKSTHALLTGAQKGGGQVTAVDHWQGAKGQEKFFPEVAYLDMYHVFMANVGGFPNLTVLKMPSLEGASQIETAEMIFIDGGHEYEEIKADLEAWDPKTTKLVCGHDYPMTGVKKAVMERYGVPKIVDTIWYIEKGQ